MPEEAGLEMTAAATTGGAAAASVLSSEDAAATALCDHIRKKGFQSHIFSDITISFLSKDYPLHKIVLSQSSYFLSLLAGPWKEHGKAKIQLQIDDSNVTAQGLEIALAYLYGVTPVLNEQNVVAVLAAGCFLCLDNLCDMSVHFIVGDLRVETFLTYQTLSERHCYGKHVETVRAACWSFLCSHAARELLHVLPKLSLQVLCRLLKSDEIWVPNELERHKLAKQVLIDWKIARVKVANTPTDSAASKRHKLKFTSAHKSIRSRSLRCNKLNSKISRGTKRKGSPVCSNEISSPQEKEVDSETDLQKLKRLWEENAADPSYGSQDDFDMCIDLFTGNGIIYAHMEVDELFSVKKELEDANLPSDAINDSIWQNALLNKHLVRLGESHTRGTSSDDDDLEMDDDEDDDDEDDDEDDEDEDEDEVDYDEEEESSDRDSDDSSSRNAVTTESPKRSRVESCSLVCFSCLELDSPESVESKRRKTTSGFTWAAKPDIGMRLKDFPPFRFGVEYIWKDKKWNLDPKHKSLFYAGSLWTIAVTYELDNGWHFGVYCQSRKNVFDAYPYSDTRKKVRFMARLHLKTASGLWRVTGTGLREWITIKIEFGSWKNDNLNVLTGAQKLLVL
ncbi:hypothetical protein SUGI_0586130 [Cryptomeria japonica]|nr:hypothetical protein SUGI_0586130 [Cryptomeria japonica]